MSIPGIETNTGSLGMGISKAKGLLWAKKYLKKKGNVIVLIGDGEFQEGQIFEALQSTVHQKLNDLIVIMDHNKVQSSQYVKKIIDLLDLKKKLKVLVGTLKDAMDIILRKLIKFLQSFQKLRTNQSF